MRTSALLLSLCLIATACAGDAPPERSGLVRGKGGVPLTLIGPALAEGVAAPRAILHDAACSPCDIVWNDGQVRIVTTAPSLDTPTCSRQAKAFSAQAAALAPAIQVVFVSRDLPFAQARFCAAEGVAGIRVLSDYYDGGFTRAWGLFIKENGLAARAVAVVDGGGVIRHLQIVADLPREPDYAAALAAAKALLPR